MGKVNFEENINSDWDFQVAYFDSNLCPGKIYD